MTAVGGPTEGRLEADDGIALRTLTWTASPLRANAVLVHGLGEHAGRYDHVARALGHIGCTVVAYDQRGHGDSPGPRGHAESVGRLLADLDAAWDLRGDTDSRVPRFLVGHSLGGLVSLAWTQTRDRAVAGLVLSAPWLATALPVPWWKRAGARILNRIVPSLPMDTGTRPQHLTSDPEMIDAYEDDPMVHHRTSPRLFLDVERWQRRVVAHPRPLTVPTLILLPGRDPLADSVTTRRIAGRAAVVELPESRHEPFNEVDRGAAIARVVDWIDGLIA